MKPENELSRKIAELESRIEALSVSEIRLKRAEIASKSGNWELHLDTGRIVGSEGAMKIYGLDDQDFDYKIIKGFPLPEYRTILDNALKDLIERDIPYEVKFKIKNAKTGKIIDLRSTAFYDKSRRTVFGIMVDITSQVENEELLRKSNERLTSLLQTSIGLLEVSDKKNILTNILEAAISLIHLDTAAVYSIKGTSIYLESTIPPLADDFPSEFRKAEIKDHSHINKSLDIKAPLYIEDILEEPLTEQEKVIISARDLRSVLYIPLIAGGMNYGILILASSGRLYRFTESDINLCRTFSNIATVALENSMLVSTLESAKEKAEESDRLKTAFIHNISHEIRTPLNAIIGFSDFLCREDLCPEEKNYFSAIINNSTGQLLDIINDLFNVSQLEAGLVLLNEKEFDLHHVLNNIESKYKELASFAGLNFRISLLNIPEGSFRIVSDEVKLYQSLCNLLNNSLKFTASGEIELRCENNGSSLRFTVKDTGIGIPESEHQKIFERFYQVNKSVSRVYPGAGLGLTISYEYVKILGGKLKVESEPEKGSTFHFEIPLKQSTVEAREDKVEKEVDRYTILSARTILVAEDEKSNYQLLEMLLKNANVNLIHAETGAEAVDLCKSDLKIDLVLMDMKMPVMDGYEATSIISKLRPGLPIVAQTAYAEGNDRSKAMAAGCCDLLAKPFNRTQLYDIITRNLT